MKYFLFIAFVLLPIVFFQNCTNKLDEVDDMFETLDTDVEHASEVTVIYSDSATVRLKVSGPKLERYVGKKNSKDVFNAGVHVEFLDENQKTLSWLDAIYLERAEKSGFVYVRDSVVLYNDKDEKLETSELIWDEVNEFIFTEKFVRITQPEKGDTSYGYGFETNKDFSEFTIKNRFSAKMNIEDISEALGQ